MPLSSCLQYPTKLLHLGVAAHKPREAAGCRRLQARASASGRGDLEDLEWPLEPLDRPGPQRADHDVTFNQLDRRRRDENRARHGHLLQARRQMGSLTDGCVVHVEVAADRADHYLARVHTPSNVHWRTCCPMHFLRVSLD